jgi:hypothetical protein
LSSVVLPAPLLAHHRPPFAAADGHVQPVVDDALAVALVQVLDHRHLVARAGRGAELEFHHLALLRQLDLLDLVERLDAALHLRRLGGVGLEAFDEALLLGQHRLLARERRLLVGLANRPLALVEVVVARVHRHFAGVDLGDLVDDAVHELAVVRGHQQRAGERLQELLEPDDRLDVEVVGRLVHQQHVGLAEQHPGQRHPHLPAARQRADVAVNLLVGQSEAVQHLARLRLEGVAAEMFVLFLHLAEAGQHLVQPVGLLGIFHRLLQGLELVVQVAQAAAAGNGLVQHRTADISSTSCRK